MNHIKVNKRTVVICVACISLLSLLFLYTTLTTAVPSSSTTSCVTPSNIDQLIQLLNSSDTSVERPPCFTAVQHLLDKLYTIEISQDSVEVPEKMMNMVLTDWLKGDMGLFRRFQNPTTMIITDKALGDTTVVNPLRAARPRPRGHESEYDDVLKMIEGAREGCNFCNKELTLKDSFGRVETEKKNIYTAENAFRFYDFVGMVIPGDVHNYMDIDYETFQTMITQTAVIWYTNVCDRNTDRSHPMLIWDMLAKAGASQVHPHFQVYLGRGRYPGKMGQLASAAQRYTDGSYLTDLVNAHIALGLGLRHKTAAVIILLTATKDHEIMIVGTDNVYDWTWLYYLAHRMYIEDLKVFCYSQGAALPSWVMGPGRGTGDLMVARLGSRGPCTSSYSDVSSLELYTTSIISTDFYKTMAAYQRTYDKYRDVRPDMYVGM